MFAKMLFPSFLAMAAMATAITTTASRWAVAVNRSDGTRRTTSSDPPDKKELDEKNEGDDKLHLHLVTMGQALFFSVAAGAGLLCLWYFPNVLGNKQKTG